jgi:putative RecB family exonuclease
MSLPLAPGPPRPAPRPRDHCSFSAISTYQHCPLRYYFSYVLQLPAASSSASLVFGSSVHRAVQHYFEQLQRGAEPPERSVLFDVFHEAWQGHDKPIHYGPREDFDSYCRLAHRALGTFLASDWARPEGTIVGVEREFRAPIVPGCPDVLGRVDLLVDAGDALVAADFKTARSSWSEGQVASAAPQLWMYAELVRPLAGERPLQLAFAVLTKTQVPSFTTHLVQDDAQQIERTKHVVERVWRAIETEHFYPSPSPLNCSTCPYQEPCQAWTG